MWACNNTAPNNIGAIANPRNIVMQASMHAHYILSQHGCGIVLAADIDKKVWDSKKQEIRTTMHKSACWWCCWCSDTWCEKAADGAATTRCVHLTPSLNSSMNSMIQNGTRWQDVNNGCLCRGQVRCSPMLKHAQCVGSSTSNTYTLDASSGSTTSAFWKNLMPAASRQTPKVARIWQTMSM